MSISATPNPHIQPFKASSASTSSITVLSHPDLLQAFLMHTASAASETEQKLMQLSGRVIELLNARAYDDPWFQSYVSPDVYVNFNGIIVGQGMKDFLGFYRMDADRSPEFFCDVDMTTAVVNEQQGTATVILSQVLSGFEDELMVGKKRAASILWSWKQKRGSWELQSVCMMFGTCVFLV